jgi:hypothetical protein
MAQGWYIDRTAKTIVFNEAPANGAAIVVKEFGSAGFNTTDVFAFGAWNAGYGYPGEVEYYGDRRFFARTKAQPQTIWATKTGEYRNFGRSTPIEDSDAINQTLIARQANPIYDLLPMKSLMVMTAAAEWEFTAGDGGVIAPGKNGFHPQSWYGSAPIAAQLIGNSAIFIQGRGFVVRDLGYEFAQDGFSGNDLTIYGSHLFEGHQIVDMAYQQVPYSAVWMVRDDGKVICLTYLREQQVVGFSLLETDGQVESVCTVPNGDQNAVHLVVRRFVNGAWRRYREMLADRNVQDVRDGFFVDSGLSFDFRNQVGVARLTGTLIWDNTATISFIVSGATPFVGASDVGDEVVLYAANGESARLRIVEHLNATTVLVQLITPSEVPASLRSTDAARWDLRRDTLSGLGHLEGKTVSVLSDGNVEEQKVVSGGSITLDRPGSYGHVGLPYRSWIESLDINVPGGESVRGKHKVISDVTLLVKDTRGLKAGPSLDQLEAYKERQFENYDEPTAIITGIIEYAVPCRHDKDARFVAVQDDPLPATILGLLPNVTITGA